VFTTAKNNHLPKKAATRLTMVASTSEQDMAVAIVKELQQLGFTKSASTLEKEILKKLSKKVLPASNKSLKMVEAEKTNAVAKSDSSSSDSSSDEEDAPKAKSIALKKSKPSSDSSSSSSSSSSSESEGEKAAKPQANSAKKEESLTKKVTPAKKTADSSSDSSDDEDEEAAKAKPKEAKNEAKKVSADSSDSSSDSEEDEVTPKTKKSTKAGKAKKVSKSGESSEPPKKKRKTEVVTPEEDSDSDVSDVEVSSVSTVSSSENDDSSSSDEDGSSSSSEEESEDEKDLAAKQKAKRKAAAEKAKEAAAAALAWTPKKAKKVDIKSEAGTDGAQAMSGGKPYRRVDDGFWGEKAAADGGAMADNSYENVFGADGYGAKASEKLLLVRGKRFQHEKTKRKRSFNGFSRQGGGIDMQSNSTKYKYDSD
jgi:hypothetical protein